MNRAWLYRVGVKRRLPPPPPRGDSRRRTTLHNTCPVVFVPQLSYIGFTSLDHPAYKLRTDFSFHGREREGEIEGEEIRLLTHEHSIDSDERSREDPSQKLSSHDFSWTKVASMADFSRR